jgi:hypothetical protein
VRLAPLPARAAPQREEIRVACIDDEVRLIGLDRVDHARIERLAVELRVLERDVPAPVLHVPVAGVHEVQHRLHVPLARLLHVERQARHGAIEVAPHRQERLGGDLRVHALRVVVRSREDVRARAQRAKQVLVARGVVVGVVQRGRARVDAGVHADDERERGVRAVVGRGGPREEERREGREGRRDRCDPRGSRHGATSIVIRCS